MVFRVSILFLDICKENKAEPPGNENRVELSNKYKRSAPSKGETTKMWKVCN